MRKKPKKSREEKSYQTSELEWREEEKTIDGGS
jgi:hypothetical protein